MGCVRKDMKASNRKRLLTVADTFPLEGLGVIISPALLESEYGGAKSIKVTLRRPGGRETLAEAKLHIPLGTGPGRDRFYLSLLVGITRKDVPIGTEIWTIDDRTAQPDAPPNRRPPRGVQR